MGSYSGEDTVTVYWNLKLKKTSDLNNAALDHFVDEEKNENIIEVVFDENKNIQKLYLKSIDVDLKGKIDQKLSDYLFALYEKGTKNIEDLEMEIQYDVKGYYDPGVLTGPPEYCYPPEGDEEREVTGSTIIFDQDNYFNIPTEYLDKIQDNFSTEIEKNTFNYSDDGPDYYDDDDRDYDNYY